MPAMFAVEAADFLREPELSEEVFGPATLVVSYGTREEMLRIARGLKGHLTATLHGTDEDLHEYRELVEILEQKAGRLVFNGFPTGVEVGHAIIHGGPVSGDVGWAINLGRFASDLSIRAASMLSKFSQRGTAGGIERRQSNGNLENEGRSARERLKRARGLHTHSKRVKILLPEIFCCGGIV